MWLFRLAGHHKRCYLFPNKALVRQFQIYQNMIKIEETYVKSMHFWSPQVPKTGENKQQFELKAVNTKIQPYLSALVEIFRPVRWRIATEFYMGIEICLFLMMGKYAARRTRYFSVNGQWIEDFQSSYAKSIHTIAWCSFVLNCRGWNKQGVGTSGKNP